jgi:iron complex outermembrane receptor protein
VRRSLLLNFRVVLSRLLIFAFIAHLMTGQLSHAAETEDERADGETSKTGRVAEIERLTEIESTALYNDLELLVSENLVFTASKRVESTRIVPVATTVIPLDQLRSLGRRSIPQVLRLFPGMEVIQVTRTEFTVGLRGFANRSNFRSRDVLVLVDGRTVYDDFSGNVEWETLDIFPEDVAKIEVIRGAGSSIHGPNAARGVINIITKPPEAISTLEADSVILRDGFRQRIGTSLTLGSYSLKVTGGYDEADIWNRFEGFSLSNSNGIRTWMSNMVLSKHLAGGGQIRLGGGTNTGDLLLHRSSTTLAFNDQSTDHVRLEYDHPYLSVRSFWNFRQVKFVDARTASPGATRKQHLFDLEAVHRILNLGRSSLSWGGDARFIIIKSDSVGVNGEERQFSGGLFIDEQYNVTNALLLRLAGRLDYQDEVGLRFSPRGGVVYQADPQHTLKASVNMGYRNPTLGNNFFNFRIGSIGPMPLILKGNPDLDPEKSIWYETGYLGEFGPDLTVGLDLFYVTLSDLIQNEFIPPATLGYVNEEEDIRGGGGELWGEYRWTPSLRFLANYGYAVYQKDSQGIRGVAPHKINLGFLFTDWMGFTGALTIHYVNKAAFPFETGLLPGGTSEAESYYLLNAFIGYQFTKNLGARVEAFNFTNNKHRELPGIGEEISADFSFMIGYRM